MEIYEFCYLSLTFSTFSNHVNSRLLTCFKHFLYPSCITQHFPKWMETAVTLFVVEKRHQVSGGSTYFHISCPPPIVMCPDLWLWENSTTLHLCSSELWKTFHWGGSIQTNFWNSSTCGQNDSSGGNRGWKSVAHYCGLLMKTNDWRRPHHSSRLISHERRATSVLITSA